MIDDKPKTKINTFDVTCFEKDLHITCREQFNFAYLPVKDGEHRYFGGLQCNFEEGTEEYKQIENILCDILDKFLELNKLINTYKQ